MALSVLLMLAAFAASACALDNGLALTPPMGSLSWQRFRCNIDCKSYPNDCISEKLYMDTADRMAADGYRDAGYVYVNVDDCWSNMTRGSNNELLADNVRFPRGMKFLADYVHSKGLKFGIYGDVGRKTCDGYPGSLGFFDQDAALFASWGVDSIKLDGCEIESSRMGELYPQFGASINKTGRHMLYVCSWPAYIVGHADFQLIAKYCNQWRNWHDVDDDWRSVVSIIDWFASVQSQTIPAARPGAWNDPDMLIIGDFGLSVEQAKTQLALWSIMAAPLLMSNDLRSIRPEFAAILLNPEVIAVDQDRLGRQGGRVRKDNIFEWWVRGPLADSSYAVAIWLRAIDQGYPTRVTTKFTDLALPFSRARLRDLFARQDLGVQIDSFTVTVNPLGVVMLKIAAA